MRSCHTLRVSVGRVKYARKGDVRLAYRVMGEGDIPIAMVPGWVSNIDLYDDPTTTYGGMSQRMSQMARLLVWDSEALACRTP